MKYGQTRLNTVMGEKAKIVKGFQDDNKGYNSYWLQFLF